MPGTKSVRTLSLTATLLLLTLGLGGCWLDEPRAAAAAPPPPTVTVAKPIKRPVVDRDEYVGRFVAVDAVEVRARVSGYLDAVHFQDGQLVKKGDLLFTIDRRPFEITLAQAKANVAQARGNLAYAESDLERGQNLVRGSTITQQTFDQRLQAKRVAEANVAAQEASTRQAMLDLEFTELRAPVSGRIGDRRVSPGNLVTGGMGGTTTLLASITSLDPIRFEFTIDETSYLNYIRNAGGGTTATNRGIDVPVRLKLIDEPNFTHIGKTDFMDNAIDGASGTIRGRAEFTNPHGTFTPGMFARIQLTKGPPSEALLVPEVAISTEQVRKFVLVVDENDVVRPKYVTLGPVADTLRVITDGLSPDDRVIVNGLMRARPGVKVTPVEATDSSASAATTKTKTN
jgi:RND family efflux transporter MFP subunit